MDVWKPERPRIVVWLTHRDVACWNLDEAGAERLRARLPGVEVVRCASRAEFLEALPEAEIVVTWGFRQEWFERAPRLRWIATPAAGRDYFDVDPPPGVEVRYGAFHGPIMAETVLGMMLGVSRGLFDGMERWARGRVWDRGAISASMKSFRGSRVTLLGFGAIGSEIGRLSKLLGARICGIRRTPVAPPAWFSGRDRMATPAELDAWLPRTDHLVLALPGGPETRGILDARRLGRLPAGAALYNVGRGNAIDEDALIEALEAGRLRAACLDVFDREPLKASTPLRNVPNLLALPHVSAAAPEYLDRYLDEFAETFREKWTG